MRLSNCKECGKLFNQVTRDICPSCVKQEDTDFLKITNYLREHRGSTPQEVHDATGVKLSLIYRFIREGRLVAANFPNMMYPCEHCGIPIQVGRFCPSCQSEMTEQLKDAIEKTKQNSTTKAGYHSKLS